MQTVGAVVRALAVAGACSLSACAGTSGAPPSGTPAANAVPLPVDFADGRRHPSGKISHVVIVVQENRSFDDLFA
ncbi:MAG: hypothetical protein WB615_02465, partial [Candidatus Tumulicola sp.]